MVKVCKRFLKLLPLVLISLPSSTLALGVVLSQEQINVSADECLSRARQAMVESGYNIITTVDTWNQRGFWGTKREEEIVTGVFCEIFNGQTVVSIATGIDGSYENPNLGLIERIRGY